jgi:hypothetical protein
MPDLEFPFILHLIRFLVMQIWISSWLFFFVIAPETDVPSS